MGMHEESREPIDARAWFEDLPAADRAVADAALRLHQNFVLPHRLVGACYLLAFFLRQYLKRDLHIDAPAVVGYVCDQTTPLRMSHAWLDFGGRKTDVSLTLTEFPKLQLPGGLLVHDQVILEGPARYTYHSDQSADSLQQIASAKAAEPVIRTVLDAKDLEHREMHARAGDDDSMWAWLQGAPDHISYCRLAAAARGTAYRWPGAAGGS